MSCFSFKKRTCVAPSERDETSLKLSKGCNAHLVRTGCPAHDCGGRCLLVAHAENGHICWQIWLACVLEILFLSALAGCARAGVKPDVTLIPATPGISLSPVTTVSPSPTSFVLPTAGYTLGDTRNRPGDHAILVYVPGGEFVMGTNSQAIAWARKLCNQYTGNTAIAVCTKAAFENEYPAHTVIVSSFWIDKTEVTNSQYEECVREGACTPPVKTDSNYRATYYGEPAFADYPVVWVTQPQAVEYCTWAGGRLPTEAEWEYAARGPNPHTFPWGDQFDGTRLNYCDLNCDAGPNDPSVDDGYADTAPVGSYPAGASWVSALDMAGNVREWVADWYGKYPSVEQIDPTGPETGSGHIPRGGSWLDKPDDVRSANRGENSLDYSRHKVGFRCAMDEKP